MEPTLALLPSPLLGPTVWRPVATELRGLGWSVVEIPHPPRAPVAPGDVTELFLDALPRQTPLVLVPHSNAGLFVPALVTRRHVVGTVFVDAGVPPSSGHVPLAPPVFHDFLSERADAAGLLPPWTEWWDHDIADLFPSAEVRRAVEQEQHRLPLSYFEATLQVPDGWDRGPVAYLSFGATYAEERGRAQSRGWPVRTLQGGHLHQLVDPGAVAQAVADLASSLAPAR